jgi:hypothetical protein
MSDVDNGGQAFPSDSDESGFAGMTLRDYFASQVILGYLRGEPIHIAAQRAYAAADAMIAVRNLKKAAQ